MWPSAGLLSQILHWCDVDFTYVHQLCEKANASVVLTPREKTGLHGSMKEHLHLGAGGRIASHFSCSRSALEALRTPTQRRPSVQSDPLTLAAARIMKLAAGTPAKQQ